MDARFPHAEDNKEHESTSSSSNSGQPHESLFLILAYLPLLELLSMAEVCRSLRDAVNDDILPWLSITVRKPLNSRLTDEILMKIISKSDGRLKSLALIDCFKITDSGLLHVIRKNPNIIKLYVPGCTSLTPEGLISAVKELTRSNHRLKILKVRGIYNLSKQHLEVLHSCIGLNETIQLQQNRQYEMYHKRMDFSDLRTEGMNCPIDVGICPRCAEVRPVFSCSRNACKRRGLDMCIGCTLCITRCEECGRCMGVEDEEKAACWDLLCSDCWLRLPKCNFCNKPYCNQHADKQQPCPSGFLCSYCYWMYTKLEDRDVDY